MWVILSPDFLNFFFIYCFRGNECLHGVAARNQYNATVFPQSLGLAATFDTALLHAIGDAISDEARALFNMGSNAYLTCWAPNMNICEWVFRKSLFLFLFCFFFAPFVFGLVFHVFYISFFVSFPEFFFFFLLYTTALSHTSIWCLRYRMFNFFFF